MDRSSDSPQPIQVAVSGSMLMPTARLHFAQPSTLFSCICPPPVCLSAACPLSQTVSCSPCVPVPSLGHENGSFFQTAERVRRRALVRRWQQAPGDACNCRQLPARPGSVQRRSAAISRQTPHDPTCHAGSGGWRIAKRASTKLKSFARPQASGNWWVWIRKDAAGQ